MHDLRSSATEIKQNKTNRNSIDYLTVRRVKIGVHIARHLAYTQCHKDKCAGWFPDGDSLQAIQSWIGRWQYYMDELKCKNHLDVGLDQYQKWKIKHKTN